MKRKDTILRELTRVHALRVAPPADTASLRSMRSHAGPGQPYRLLRCDRTGRRTVAVR